MMPIAHDSSVTCISAQVGKLCQITSKLSFNCRRDQLLRPRSQQFRQRVRNPISTCKIIQLSQNLRKQSPRHPFSARGVPQVSLDHSKSYPRYPIGHPHCFPGIWVHHFAVQLAPRRPSSSEGCCTTPLWLEKWTGHCTSVANINLH